MTSLHRATLFMALLVTSAAHAAVPAPPRPLQIALVGDSLAYGAGDEQGKGIGGRLQPELRSRGNLTAVTTNFGTTGATTLEVAAKLRDAATRRKLAEADAIVLSTGANDVREALFGDGESSPLTLVDEVLGNIAAIVTDLRRINPRARILILGAYAPLPHERASLLLGPMIAMWDSALEAQFEDDPLVTIVRMSDIIDRPEKLSALDSFHPGGEAYQQTAARIAELLTAK